MKKSRLLLISAISLLLASCSTSHQNMAYLTDIDAIAPIELGDYSIKIEPSDELVITVTSQYPDATNVYNLPATNPATRETIVNSSQPRQQTYTVDPEGYINFPMLGKLYVKGMTVEQLRDYLTGLISKDVTDPIVTVNLVGFWVNVGGEVLKPGRVEVTSPRYSILDAITETGDLTQYGRRDNVLLVREEDGKRIHVRFDLNKSDFLSSPYFYLKQNDYVYVEPNDVRKDNAEYNQYNSYRLSVISTIVSGSASIISLIIALSR